MTCPWFDADECASVGERAVAGILDVLHTCPMSHELADYLDSTPRSGVVVTLYLDGTGKPANFDRYVMSRWIGRSGLIERSRPSKHGDRVASLDAADLDELFDACIAALGELEDATGVKQSGPQLSLRAITNAVGNLLTASTTKEQTA